MDNKTKIIISMMSGTSADAIDAVLIKIKPDMSFEVLGSHSLFYPDDVKNLIVKAANNQAKTEDICFLNFVVGELFAACAIELINKAWIDKSQIDFISSHGQTIYHIAQKRKLGSITTGSTLQIGDISVIAQRTGIKTVGDFRPKDIAAGGQGAPLVPLADEIIFSRNTPRSIQNIGGIANVTVLSPEMPTFGFDTGPGNVLIDYFTNKLFKMPYDKDGEIAAKGKIDKRWLNHLIKDDFYKKQPPKTTGREHFSVDYAKKVHFFAPVNRFNVITTITALTARTIYKAYQDFIFPKTEIQEVIVGGGGAYNKTLLKFLQGYFKNIPVKTHKDTGIDDKMKEAIAFAYIGYYALEGRPNNIITCTGADVPVVMGKLAL